MPVVTLTTDFGNKDHPTGALKGALLRHCDPLTIIDISHQIPHYNIKEAAYVMKNACFHFPEKTIHLVTVNHEDERTIRFVAMEYEKHFFIGFDNGIFSLIFNHAPDVLVEIPVPEINSTNTSFVNFELMAQTVGALAKGRNIQELGNPVSELKSLINIQPVEQESLIKGTVIYIDSYHNVVTNITKTLFNKVRNKRNFYVRFRREFIRQISDSYHDKAQGEMLCLFNSADYLEIAVNSGKASNLLGLSIGDTILIDFE